MLILTPSLQEGQGEECLPGPDRFQGLQADQDGEVGELEGHGGQIWGGGGCSPL